MINPSKAATAVGRSMEFDTPFVQAIAYLAAAPHRAIVCQAQPNAPIQCSAGGVLYWYNSLRRVEILQESQLNSKWGLTSLHELAIPAA